MPKTIENKQTTEKSLEAYNRTKPEQLALFELLAPEEKNYSNTVELYDFIPKYYWGKTEEIRVEGKFSRFARTRIRVSRQKIQSQNQTGEYRRIRRHGKILLSVKARRNRRRRFAKIGL